MRRMQIISIQMRQPLEGNDIRNIITYHFKPDYAFDNLPANNYIPPSFCFDAELLLKVEPSASMMAAVITI